MNSIAENLIKSKPLVDNIGSFVEKYIGSSLLRKCGITKMVDVVRQNPLAYHDSPLLKLIGKKEDSPVLNKVVSARDLLIDKIMTCFWNASPYRMFKTNTYIRNYKKDTFYRFDTMQNANWERLQLETARNVIVDFESRTTGDHINALLFDDSLYSRTGGKGTQLCGRVYDHNDHKLRLGYRMMTGGWTNGDSFVPFAQALLTTNDPKLMVGPDEAVDCRTIRGKRRKTAKTKGTVVVEQMIDRAQKVGIPFNYVLFDTWFSSPSQLIAIKQKDTNVIAMIKKNSTKYTVTDSKTGEKQKLNVNEIYSRNKKRRGKSKYLLSVDAEISDKNGNTISVKLVYARNHSNKKDWVCFISTDTSISEEMILRIYTMRWKIEVYFKIAKSYLKLRTECHSPNYDAITSHMVVVSLRYMILALERFNNTDNRTIEDLFYGVQREIMNAMMDCAIILLLDIFLETVEKHFNATEKQMTLLVNEFIGNLPQEWKERFQVSEAS